MRYELFISLRYLRARRKEAFISLITFFSTLGVGLGVMALNMTLSIMTGFSNDLRDRLLGFNPHVVVQEAFGGWMEGWKPVMERVTKVPGVVRAEPYIYGPAVISTENNASGILVRGVLPEQNATPDIARYMKVGAIRDLGKRHPIVAGDERGGIELPGIVLGQDLMRQLRLLDVDDFVPGQIVSLFSPIGTPTGVGMVPRIRRFVVVGMFRSGMSEYDNNLAYVALEESQRFFAAGDAVSGIEVAVQDVDRAPQVRRDIEGEVGLTFRVRDWTETNKALFNALKFEKYVYSLVLLLIILVAAFNIVAMLTMVVMEKRKDIAVLKSMGAPSRSIARIFVTKGLIIGTVGTLAGTVLALGGCWLLVLFPFPLDPDVWPMDHVPVQLEPLAFVVVAATALLICLVATLYPARQAARTVPVDVIRYE